MTRLAAAAAALAAVAACRGHRTVPAGARVGPALAAALSAAEAVREPWRCAAPDGPGAPEESLAIGGHTWRIAGHALVLDPAGGMGDRGVAIGVVADAAGSAPATLAALRRLRDRLAHVDLMVTLGGMGATAAELDAVFAVLADRAPWPLVALPGDLEPVPAQVAAIAAARKRNAPVFDGRLVQRIELPGATIAVVPGAAAASRLGAGPDGCRYRPADATAAFADLTPRPGLRILASAEPPRDDGELPAGELAVTAGAGEQIDVALHGPSREAATPACRGGRDGAAVAVTPGTSDATARLPEMREMRDPRDLGRAATAGVLTVRGGAWTWQPVDDTP